MTETKWIPKTSNKPYKENCLIIAGKSHLLRDKIFLLQNFIVQSHLSYTISLSLNWGTDNKIAFLQFRKTPTLICRI